MKLLLKNDIILCMNALIIISGPGGSGKDAVIKRLLEDDSLHLKDVASFTSRKPRIGEVNGVNLYFLTREQFEREIERGQMLEYELMETSNQYYGTHKKEMLEALSESDAICRKMPWGALELKKYFGDQALTVFIDATDQELEQRLLESHRSLEHDQVARRLKQAQHEREYKDKFDLVVQNPDDELDQTVAKVKAAIQTLTQNTKKETT